jgi:hypothetical protein
MELFHVVFVLFGAFFVVTEGFWRMPCANYPGTYRLDAIMVPGKLSPHAHTLHGGSGFTWNATTDSLIASTATSCGVSEDKSAY